MFYFLTNICANCAKKQEELGFVKVRFFKQFVIFVILLIENKNA